MSGKQLWLGIRAAAIVAIAAGAAVLIAGQALAQGPSVSATDGSGGIGDRVDVELSASEIEAPGLAAWSIDISYDPDILEAVSCTPSANTGTQVCNEAFSDSSMRLAGASATGLTGDPELATARFECIAAGTSPIEIGLVTFADGTLGDPQPIDASVNNGEIRCAGAAGLPDSGQGAGSDGGNAGLFWVIAALAVAGMAFLMGAQGLRRMRA
jgi:hypothetical protein